MKRGLSVLIAAAWAMSASALTLEDASLRIVLGEAEDGFGVKGVVNRLAGDVSFGALAGGRDLWEVRFMKKGATTNEFCTVSNRSSARTRRHERGTDGLRLIWQGVDLPNESGVLDVTAEVRLTAAAFVNASDRAQDVRYRLPDETEWRKTTLAAFQLKLEEQKEK